MSANPCTIIAGRIAIPRLAPQNNVKKISMGPQANGKGNPDCKGPSWGTAGLPVGPLDGATPAVEVLSPALVPDVCVTRLGVYSVCQLGPLVCRLLHLVCCVVVLIPAARIFGFTTVLLGNRCDWIGHCLERQTVSSEAVLCAVYVVCRAFCTSHR